MSREEILLAILMLSRSQGSYGRLYQILTNGSDEAEECLQDLVEQNFSDLTELVLYIEG